MIARVWTGRTTGDKAPAYAEYLRTHVFAGLHEIDGFEQAMLLQRPASAGAAESVEVEVITFWRSLDAIGAFAGADVEAAVVTDTAKSLLTDYDHRARHYAVVLRDEA